MVPPYARLAAAELQGIRAIAIRMGIPTGTRRAPISLMPAPRMVVEKFPVIRHVGEAMDKFRLAGTGRGLARLPESRALQDHHALHCGRFDLAPRLNALRLTDESALISCFPRSEDKKALILRSKTLATQRGSGTTASLVLAFRPRRSHTVSHCSPFPAHQSESIAGDGSCVRLISGAGGSYRASRRQRAVPRPSARERRALSKERAAAGPTGVVRDEAVVTAGASAAEWR